MQNYFELSYEELTKTYSHLINCYENFKSQNLKIDISRGKPASEQLDLSLGMLDVLSSSSDLTSRDGVDMRNYGICDGIPEMKEFISNLSGIAAEKFIVGGNSSLGMMFDAISYFMIKGARGCEPWIKQGKVKFLCPSPGYDRHFAISEYFDMDMITIPMNSGGPDMDLIEDLVAKDDMIKGIWCVPKYSNPQGITYSDETVRRLAALQPAARDFKIMWDNAYFVHGLCEDDDKLLDIMSECEKNENENMPLIFFSTSKITFPGAGVAFMACGGENLKLFKKMYSVKTVGFDKLNQLRHLRFLKDKSGVLEHMKKHRQILKPKFDMIIDLFSKEFKDNPIITWINPKGGYFISVEVYRHCAKRVVELCQNAGVILTKAGATFPYGEDPDDSNIRIAPSCLDCAELKVAMELFCLCVKLAFVEMKLDLQI
ncbi:MAG: aminotransferase class I/II-fold pyridoxal phosphate-dependent enzyme [Acutalibacteraceae bacterium]